MRRKLRTVLFPHTSTTEESVIVGTQARSGRNSFEFFRITPAKHYVVGDKGSLEPRHNILDRTLPLAAPAPL